MSATSLGLVGIVNKGNYNAQTTYVKGNFVYYNYSSWLLKADSATGSEPSLSNTDWQPLALGINLAVFTGATASADGTSGAVPQPHAGDEGKALMGDGTWDYAGELSWTGTVAQWNALSSAQKAEYAGKKVYITNDYMEALPTFVGASANENGYKGQVPTPLIADRNKYLCGDGTWKNVPDPQTMTGASSSSAGTGGLTPTPAAGDQDKFLAGDGTYKQDARVGTLSSLTTTAQNNLVAAINEIDSHADTNATAISNGIQNAFEVVTPSFSSLPVTFTVEGMTADHVLVQEGSAYLSNPSAQLGDWTLTTGANTLTISGSISGSTTVKASFGIKRQISATTTS